MSTYEYTDRYGNPFRIATSENHDGHVCLTMLDNTPTRWFPNEDAPAVALAILEAAQVKPANVNKTAGDSLTADQRAQMAAYHLTKRAEKVAEEAAEQAEREAEDAKVAAWWDDTMYGHKVGIQYADLGSCTKEDIRSEYQRHRDHFTREEQPSGLRTPEEWAHDNRDREPEPRVLNYGDPEPKVGDAWRDQKGRTWRPVRVGGWSFDGVTLVVWPEIDRWAFPMTEVLGE